MNPRKHNRYVPGTGQQIKPPVFLKEYQPDVVIIMNPIYSNEIKNKLGELNIDRCEILTV